MLFDGINSLLNIYFSICFRFAALFCNVVFVISDSHSAINPHIMKRLKNAKKIIHAGDWSTSDIYHDLIEITETIIAVHGNTETIETEMLFPEKKIFYINRNKIHLEHEIDSVKDFTLFYEDGGAPDLVIFGHTHKILKKKIKNIVFFNPGSCGPKRFANTPPSYGVIYFFGKFFFIRSHKIYFQ